MNIGGWCEPILGDPMICENFLCASGSPPFFYKPKSFWGFALLEQSSTRALSECSHSSMLQVWQPTPPYDTRIMLIPCRRQCLLWSTPCALDYGAETIGNQQPRWFIRTNMCVWSYSKEIYTYTHVYNIRRITGALIQYRWCSWVTGHSRTIVNITVMIMSTRHKSSKIRTCSSHILVPIRSERTALHSVPDCASFAGDRAKLPKPLRPSPASMNFWKGTTGCMIFLKW